jgi:hypothetical protein
MAVAVPDIGDLALDGNDFRTLHHDMLLLDAAHLEAIDVHFHPSVSKSRGPAAKSCTVISGVQQGQGRVPLRRSQPNGAAFVFAEAICGTLPVRAGPPRSGGGSHGSSSVSEPATTACLATGTAGGRARRPVDDLRQPAFDPIVAAFDAVHHGATGTEAARRKVRACCTGRAGDYHLDILSATLRPSGKFSR